MGKQRTGTRTINPSPPETLLLDDEAGTNEGAWDHGQDKSYQITGVHLFTPTVIPKMMIMNTGPRLAATHIIYNHWALHKAAAFGNYGFWNFQISCSCSVIFETLIITFLSPWPCVRNFFMGLALVRLSLPLTYRVIYRNENIVMIFNFLTCQSSWV